MSFGASGSLRFDVDSQNEKPVIFWQADGQKKANKKFGYRKKELKYPLRKANQAEPEPAGNKKSMKSEQNVIKKNKEKVSGKLVRTKNGLAKENGGYYTLTHEQLNSILKSVGKIASLRGDGVNIGIDQAVYLEKQPKDPITNELLLDEDSKGEKGTDNQHIDQDLNKVQQSVENEESSRINGETTGRQSKATDHQQTDRREKSKQRKDKKARIVEPEKSEQSLEKRTDRVAEEKASPQFSPPPIPKSHMTKAERLRLQSQQDPGTHIDGSSDNVLPGARRVRNPLTNSVADDPPSMIKFHIPPILPKAHLTMAEKKRLQWEIERGETINTPPSKKKSPSKEKTYSEVETPSEEKDLKGNNSEKVNEADMLSPRTVPKAHLTQAERKRAQWEAERAEIQTGYDPWGRPGAGAPIRTNSGHTLADYKTRKEQALRISLEASSGPVSAPQPPPVPVSNQSPRQPPPAPVSNQSPRQPPRTTVTESPRMNPASLPAAMRSSFAIGYVAPDEQRFKSTKEEERRQWLEDLEKQKEEKRLQKMKEKEKDKEYFAETWADKLTYEHPSPRHGAPQVTGLSPGGAPASLPEPLPRVGSAPEASTPAMVNDEGHTYIRGQGAFLDPATRKELDEKKRRHLEHQAAVIAQVQEKQRLKRLERERKIQEEQGEERKLQEQRDVLQRQYDLEQQKTKLKEAAREHQLEQLKDAMDQAQLNAQQEKYSRRMQHLQMGGHDIKKLQANIEEGSPVPEQRPPSSVTQPLGIANFSPHPTFRHVAPVSVPGLDLTPRPWHAPDDVVKQAVPSHLNPTKALSSEPEHRAVGAEGYNHQPYIENRVLTPSVLRRRHDNPLSPHREFGTQTDAGLLPDEVSRQASDDSITYKENKQPFHTGTKKVKVTRKEKVKEKRNDKPPIARKVPLKINERPKWGTHNPKQKKPTKQSEKDPFYEHRQQEREERKLKREQELLALVEANKRVIPQKTVNISRHRDINSEYTERENYLDSDRLRPLERFEVQRARARQSTERSQSPPAHRNKSPTRSPNQGHRVVDGLTISHGLSPPVPALRHKLDSWREPKDFNNDFDLDAHNYDKLSQQKTRHRYERHPVESHYVDEISADGPFDSEDFVPFTRTSEILEPARAAVPVVVSRESSAVTRARQEYHKGQHPGAHGNQLEYFDDKKYKIISPAYKDPILNPNVVKGHPTPRQDLILQQLSDLKMNLMQRRREIETCVSPSELNQRDELNQMR